MALYEDLIKRSIGAPLVGDIKKGSLKVRDDDFKIIEGTDSYLDINTPWVFAGRDGSRLCRVWSQIYFEKYRIISRNCFNCWKVTMRFNHLDQLMKVKDFQAELYKEDPILFTGKCGCETRAYATWKGRYAAFWY